MKNSTNRKILLVTLLISSIAVLFWTGSRYPQLNEKAMMEGDMPTEGISFDVLMEVKADDPAYIKILYNTINWVETNKKGMTFGLLFAAALILLFSLIGHRQFKNRWLNSFIGLIMGVPLGVCVNCAAPIAKGICDAGGRAETALASMISSPTLNVIVLAMLFAMFPSYMVYTKLGLTIGFILVGIPLLTKLFPPESVSISELTEHADSAPPVLPFTLTESFATFKKDSWMGDISWLGINYIKSFWFIVKTAVPLMLLAGLLGNILITFLPLDYLVSLTAFPSMAGAILLMIVLAVVGTILPVPMTFDVIIVAVLMTAGLPPVYAMILLTTLGIFSIYSYLIVNKALSFKLSTAIFTSVICLGLLGGVIVHFWGKFIYEKEQDKLEQIAVKELQNKNFKETLFKRELTDQKLLNTAEVETLISNANTSFESTDTDQPVKLFKQAFHQKDTNNLSTFTKIEGHEIGLGIPYQFSIKQMAPPYVTGGSIASGDVHQDGHPDIAVAYGSTAYLFANLDGKSFSRQPINLPPDVEIQNIALVDLNNDQWLDIYLSTYLEGNYILYSKSGRFEASSPQKLLAPQGMKLTSHTAFGDVNKNGLLDMFWSNWSIGPMANMDSLVTSKNYWMENQGSSWLSKEISGWNGETLTSLISDIDLDGNLDLAVGNDHLVPDYFYKGDGRGNWQEIMPEDSLIAAFTRTTMSIISSDLNNDLVPEIFSVQTGSPDKGGIVKNDEMERICASISTEIDHQLCLDILNYNRQMMAMITKNDMSLCPPGKLAECAALCNTFQFKTGRKFCDDLPPSLSYLTPFCDYTRTVSFSEKNLEGQTIPQLRHQTVLLVKDEAGRYKNEAESWGLKNNGWAWNAKFADLDNDEYQDLYVVNGFFRKSNQPSNYLFRNMGGTGFKNITVKNGLESFIPTMNYTYVDFDNDGDLDIITTPEIGPMMIYQNNLHQNKSIAFELRDYQGNSQGIGAKIFIYYGDGKHQYREILLSGGYKSYDEAVAFFGLGDHQTIDKVIVHWSTGEQMEFDQPFESGHRYRFVRGKKD